MAIAWGAAGRRAAVLGLVLVQHGCPPPVHEVTFDRRYTLDPRPLAGQPLVTERMLVVADVERMFFPEPMFDGFHDAMTNRLSACGVQLSVVYVDPTALGSEDSVATELARSHPSSVIMVRGAGGKGSGDSDLFGHFRYTGKMRFDVSVLDPRSQAPAWRAIATADVAIGYYWDISANSGARLATGIASRLRDDGVLTGCPPRERPWPEITPPPGCVQERRRELHDALELHDEYARAAKLREVPTCATGPGPR